MDEYKHSPLPWTYEAERIQDGDGNDIGELFLTDHEDNEAFIVQAVNEREQLIEALTYILNTVKLTGGSTPIAIAKATVALSKAKGQ